LSLRLRRAERLAGEWPVERIRVEYCAPRRRAKRVARLPTSRNRRPRPRHLRMDGRRREAIASEARRLLAGACCALGGLAGVWTAIWSLPVTHRRGTIGADLAALA